jgi:inosine/xanthosine triphosphatase
MKPRISVAVGSTNPVKVAAVKLALAPYFEAEVLSVETPSGVSRQPLGEEAFLGARNRAKRALDLARSDLAAGIEGGIIGMNGRRYAFAAVVVMNSSGFESSSTTGLFPLPEESLRLVDAGMELGEAMDRISGMDDVKRGPGAVGLLTKGVIDRTSLYQHGVTLALIPHVSTQFTWQR